MTDEHREKLPKVITVDAISDRPQRPRALPAPSAELASSPSAARSENEPVASYRDVLASIGSLKFGANPRHYESRTQDRGGPTRSATVTTATQISGHHVMCSTTVVVRNG